MARTPRRSCPGRWRQSALTPAAGVVLAGRGRQQVRAALFRAAGATGLAAGLGYRWWSVAAEGGFAVGAGGAGGSVGQELEVPAHPVHADVMVVGAQHHAVSGCGVSYGTAGQRDSGTAA